MEWGEYKLGDLFEVTRGLSMYVKDKESFVYVSKNNPNAIPLVQQMNHSNGISAYIDKSKLPDKFNNKVEKAGLISINPDQPLSYYQATEFIGNSVIIIDTSKLIKNQALYIVTEIQRIRKGSTWNDKFPKEQVKIAKIQLPTKNGKIDFDFMESFIAELEAERIAKLEAYLLATGLKDYTLTAKEKQVLQDFVNGKFAWDEYKIEDVLQWQSQKEIDPLKLEELKDETEMVYPFYGQSTINNGIISYHQLTNKVLNNKDGKPTILIHSNNQNIVYLETPFYLKDGHGATSVLQGEKLSKVNQMVIVASIDKVIKNKFSYNNKATKIELKSTVINLPTQNNQPNYAIMETFISAIQKLVIKEVVLYADRKIAATKTVVNK